MRVNVIEGLEFAMMDDRLTPLMSPQDALVATMIAVSIADQDMQTSELLSIARIVDYMPAFAGYDTDRIATISEMLTDLFEEEEGLDALFGLVRDALPEELFETAYAISCDVAAADGKLRQSELRILEEIRYELNIDRLAAAAIERGARARHKTL
jgi:tellurite resistance protein